MIDWRGYDERTTLSAFLSRVGHKQSVVDVKHLLAPAAVDEYSVFDRVRRGAVQCE